MSRQRGVRAPAQRSAAKHWTGAALAFLLCSGGLPRAAAVEPAAAPRTKPETLMSQFGTAAAERLLASDASLDRRRGLLRLSALGTPRAVELLAKALDPGGAARGAEEHLVAVRALAPHAVLTVGREALVRTLSSPPAEGDAGALSDWVRAAAALALAKTQDASALSALGRALRKPGAAAEFAKQALLDNPPRDLGPLLGVPGAATRELCELLGQLGDQRAEGTLREIVRRGAPDARAAAALALLDLGSTEVVELARHWLRSERQPVLLIAATEILTRTRERDAATALSQLAQNEVTREAALTLALRTDGSLVLPKQLDLRLAAERAAALLELWARSGGAANKQLLEGALASPETAALACYALARSPLVAAGERLWQAMAEPNLRAFAVRALSLRSQRLSTDSEALLELLPGLLVSKLPAERAAAAFAFGVLKPARLASLIGSSDAVVVRAAARLAFVGPAAQAAVARLVHERDPIQRAALSIGLADPSAAEQVPTPVLLELAHAGGPGSHLAAAALAARKDEELLPLLRELLGSGDPWLRAHVVLGLSRARDADVLGMIEAAYRFEPDASVRHAAVVALSRRSEPVKQRTLRLAADLDGSRLIREAAGLALSGHSLHGPFSGSGSLWLELPRTRRLEAAAAPTAVVRVGFALALPLVADPDGLVTLAGVDSARVELRLALPGERVNGPGASR